MIRRARGAGPGCRDGPRSRPNGGPAVLQNRQRTLMDRSRRARRGRLRRL